MDTCICEVVAVKEFATRSSGTPDGQLGFSRAFCLYNLAHQGGQHVRSLEIEIIAGPIEVSWHCGQIAGAVLTVIRPAHLDASDFGQRVCAVSRLKRASQQVLFLDGLRSEFRIDAA